MPEKIDVCDITIVLFFLDADDIAKKRINRETYFVKKYIGRFGKDQAIEILESENAGKIIPAWGKKGEHNYIALAIDGELKITPYIFDDKQYLLYDPDCPIGETEVIRKLASENDFKDIEYYEKKCKDWIHQELEKEDNNEEQKD